MTSRPLARAATRPGATPVTMITRMFTALAATALATALAPSAANAQNEQSSTVTWSVSPGTSTGADGRSWVEHELDPGDVVVEHAVIRNLGDADVEFVLTAADGYFTDKGRFNMLPADRESVDAGTWITLPASVRVAAGASEIVPFTITVPDNATPGDHAAGVAASITSAGSTDSGAQVGVESRVGFRVVTTVTGELSASLSVDAATASYEQSWNPFQPGTVTVATTALNSGNVQLAYSESVDDASHERGALLPGETRSGTASFSAWPIFLIPVEVTLDGAPANASTKPAVATRTVHVWAIPYPQLLLLLGVGLILFAAVTGRRRSKKRLALLLDEAREQGRRSVGS